MDQSLSDLLYSKTNGSKRWKTITLLTNDAFEWRRQCQFRFYVPTISGLLQLHALITSNRGQYFAGNSELFPVWRHSFRNYEMIYEIDHILNCGYEIKWSHDPRTSEFIFQGSLCSCKNCLHNCEDHSFIWFCIRSSIYDLFQGMISSLIHSSREHWNPQMRKSKPASASLVTHQNREVTDVKRPCTSQLMGAL